MAPFSTKMSRSNPRQTFLLLLIPIGILGIVLLLNYQDNPSTTFKKYQKAFIERDWSTAIGLSDQNTRAYVGILHDWVWNGRLQDLESLEGFQQFLILTTRCRVLGENRTQVTDTDMFAIWMEALKLNRIIPQADIKNRYSFGESSIGQLFIERTNTSTGLKIHFSKADHWKIESMTLLKETYERVAAAGSRPLLREVNADYFAKGFKNQHLMPLRMQVNATVPEDSSATDRP